MREFEPNVCSKLIQLAEYTSCSVPLVVVCAALHFIECCDQCFVVLEDGVDCTGTQSSSGWNHVFPNRSVKQREDMLTNKLAANAHVIARKTQISQCAAVNNWGDMWNIGSTLVGNYVSAVYNVSYILFINPRALFYHYHIKCHPINIHKISYGNRPIY